MTIHDWLTSAARELKQSDITPARLDAEIILAHTLKRSRTWLHGHADESIDQRSLEIANARIELRKDHTPIAYIIGHKEFYGRPFIVTPSVLIPRPESEVLIDLLKEAIDTSKLFAHPKLLDVGTGSGCLGITAKLERPELDVMLTDISRHALTIAKRNAHQLNAEVRCSLGNLLENYHFKVDYILANLPYVDESWYRNHETDFEPSLALFADQGGLKLIFQLIEQAAEALTSDGKLLLEADPRQHDEIIAFAKKYGLNLVEQRGYGLLLTAK